MFNWMSRYQASALLPLLLQAVARQQRQAVHRGATGGATCHALTLWQSVHLEMPRPWMLRVAHWRFSCLCIPWSSSSQSLGATSWSRRRKSCLGCNRKDPKAIPFGSFHGIFHWKYLPKKEKWEIKNELRERAFSLVWRTPMDIYGHPTWLKHSLRAHVRTGFGLQPQVRSL